MSKHFSAFCRGSMLEIHLKNWKFMHKKDKGNVSVRVRSQASARLNMKEIEQSFREAFERHADELFRHASLRLPDHDRALELTQECFLKVLQYVHRGEEVREMRPFLFRTLRNLIIDEYRKGKSFSLDAMVEDDEGGIIE